MTTADRAQPCVATVAREHPAPPAVHGYLRVSTIRQGESGLGLEAQTAAIPTARPDATLHTETASAGTLTGRPILTALLNDLDRNGGTLVVAKLDRLARSSVDFGAILARAQRNGWDLVILDLQLDTATPFGRFAAMVLAAVAELERDMIRTRTREAAAAKRARGGRGGRPSTLDPAVTEHIGQLRATGHSWAAVADELNIAGHRTPTGREWTREAARAAATVGDDDRAAHRRAARERGRIA